MYKPDKYIFIALNCSRASKYECEVSLISQFVKNQLSTFGSLRNPYGLNEDSRPEPENEKGLPAIFIILK